MLSKLSIKLNFTRASGDSISFSGTLPVKAGFNPANQKVVIDVGGAQESAVLDAKGRSATFKLGLKSKKGGIVDQIAKYSVKLSKRDFAAAFADEGLTSGVETITTSITVRIIFDGAQYERIETVTYKSRAGGAGSATSN
jgi:hypothetical protein